MTYSQMRTYSRYQGTYKQPKDFIEIIRSISPLTRVGALCFVFGKLMGILALPAAFIPSLSMFVVPLVIIWGSMVFTAIVLCSIDHYHKKRNESQEAHTKLSHQDIGPNHTDNEKDEVTFIPLKINL
jgi:hypothetical protein